MDFDDMTDRLADERPVATPQELDRVKQRVLAADRRAAHRAGVKRTRLVTLAVVTALTVGTGGVISMAGGASGNQNGSAKSLECPPSSPAGNTVPKAESPAGCGHVGGK